MKIAKLWGTFLLAFLIGSFSTLITKSVPVLKIANPDKKLKELPATPAYLAPEKPQLLVFNTENFWDDSIDKHNKRLLETGAITNIEDIKAKSGETWFGLFERDGKKYLRATKIKISVKQEHGFDWKEVSIKGKTEPLFLAKISKNLTEGEVCTLFRGKTFREIEETEELNDSNTIREGFSKKFNLGEKEYTLREEKRLSEKQESILVLLLETESVSQVLHYIYFAEEGDYVGNLYWVGDLDRDDQPDLFMDFYGYEKGGYTSGLFLSSEAAKGELVKKFEYFALYTC